MQVFELGLLDRAKTDVITLSDYADDTSDLQRSQAVASIKAAAEQGRTVLLTNAAPIASSIFDLLNRHYLKTTKTEANGTVSVRYYANIAIGSYSRLCAVDQDFRIIVHTPLSAVSRTPLPFLNRFEKYTLSLQVALAEKLSAMRGTAAGGVPTGLGAPPPAPMRLQHRASSTAGATRPCDDPEVWVAALEGVTHFANAIVAPVSMPGYVAGETAAALVLRALADSQDAEHNPTGDLVLRPPVRAWSSLSGIAAAAAPPADDPMAGKAGGAKGAAAAAAAPVGDAADAVSAVGAAGFLPSDRSGAAFEAGGGAGGGPGGEGSGAGTRGRVREFIRGLNFQLLQLARPENLLVSPLALPKEYRAEYVLRQEHFSAANLMRSLMCEHWRAPLSAQAPSHAAHATSKVGAGWLPPPRSSAVRDAPYPPSSPLQVVIFSRTGADVSKLGVGGDEAAVMSIVRAAAAAAAGEGAAAWPVPSRAAVCVLQLRGMGSSHEVKERIKAFAAAPLTDAGALPHQRAMILLGDMSVVTAPQLNYARQQVRRRQHGAEGALPLACPLIVQRAAG